MPEEVTVPEQGRANAAVEPVLDRDHLRGFTEGDPRLERELSALFLATAEMYLQQMQEAVAGGRPWTAIAHALKGASANLRAEATASAAARLEAAARSGDSPEIDTLATALKTEVTRTIQYLRTKVASA